MSRLRLALFDVDGTLVDSQGHIVTSMNAAFAGEGREAPAREATLSIVGLSLPDAIGRLVPELDEAAVDRLVTGYKTAYSALHAQGHHAPLYPGASGCLDVLSDEPFVVLGIATGKSRRGLDHVLGAHDLAPRFLTRQVADDHPSKPHPAMVAAALAETGVAPEDAVMIGDTTYDMEMARAAGVRRLAVSWGYHGADALLAAGAEALALSFDEVPRLLAELWGMGDE